MVQMTTELFVPPSTNKHFLFTRPLTGIESASRNSVCLSIYLFVRHRKLILASMKDKTIAMLRLGENVLCSMFFSFLINWRTSVVIQHSDLNSRRDKAVCGKQCKTGSAIRHLCLNRGRMTRVGSRKYLQLIFQKSNSCCVRCPALRIMVHHLTTEGHCSNRRCRI